jgi:hypothetical protein
MGLNLSGGSGHSNRRSNLFPAIDGANAVHLMSMSRGYRHRHHGVRRIPKTTAADLALTLRLIELCF